MKMPRYRHGRALRLGREGVALPMALMGLLIVTLIVTSTMMSGSTEAAIGAAHQDATRAIYEANAAIDWYVAQRAAQYQDMENGTFERTLPSGTRVRFENAQLSTPAPGSDVPKVWHITAEPLTRGGRSVGALVHTLAVTDVPQPLVLDAAATIGQFAEYQPEFAQLHGTPTPGMCSDATPRVALRYPNDKHSSQTWNSKLSWPYWTDGIARTDATQPVMASRVTKDSPFSSWIARATFTIGPGFGTGSWKNVPVNAFNAPLGSNSLNWGCPAGMGAGCEGIPGATDFWPVVVIDAEASAVKFSQGVYGQGVLVILNGTLEILPPFRWKGLILVESSVKIHGDSKDVSAGGRPIWIEGALVALGNNTTKGVAPRNELKNFSTIRYNQCVINAAYTGGGQAKPLKPGDHLSFIPYARFETTR